MSIAIPASETAATSRRTVSGPLADQMIKSETAERPTFDSCELLKGSREALIEHKGELYRLRLTGTGKLYLTK